MEAGINIELINGEVRRPVGNKLSVQQVTPQPIGVVTLYPGISVEVIRNTLQQPVNALILLSYGVGNAPQNEAVLNLLKQAYDNDTIVVNCTQCMHGKVNMEGYATGKALQQVGVVSGMDMTPEATLAKLHCLLSKSTTADEVRKQMTSNLRGELTP